MSLAALLRALFGRAPSPPEAPPILLPPPAPPAAPPVPPPAAPPPAPAVVQVARVAAAVEQLAPDRAPVLPTAAMLRRIGAADPATWAPILAGACEAAGIATPRRLAYFLGSVMHETGGLRRLVESLDYDPEGLAATWPSRFAVQPVPKPPARPVPNGQARALGRAAGRPANQPGIAAAVYAGRLGNRTAAEAWRFRGRGLLQLTGRDNAERMARACGKGVDELLPWLETRPGAAISAAQFWAWCGANDAADAGDLARVRRLVNGGEIGLASVREYAEASAAAIGLA